MGSARFKTSKGAIQVLDEAVHLLRSASVGLLLTYYIGAVPFVLGSLYFVADMAESAFALQRCGPAALFLGLLFVWMKTWQAIFVAELHYKLLGTPREGWTLKQVANLVVVQATLQPSGLFLIPVSLVLTLPFGWVFAFYQNLTVLTHQESARECFRQAQKQATVDQRQNHLLLGILFLFGLFCFLNLGTLVLQGPELIKTLLGIETIFTKSGMAALNTTFIAVVFALTYLCVDPLVKSTYLLRCFYGQSKRSGEDLKAELRCSAGFLKATALSLVLFLVPITSVLAENGQNEPLGNSGVNVVSKSSLNPAPQVDPKLSVPVSELDRSIQSVLKKREFSWRLPREKEIPKPENQSWFSRLLSSCQEVLADWGRSIKRAIRDFFEWLRKLGHRSQSDHAPTGSGEGWITSLQVLFFVLIALVACTVAILFLRMYKKRQSEKVIVTEAVQATPDLNDENVVASQLPEDGWLKMARELAEQGDLRLALRALYLASLAHLSDRNLVRIAKFKSNRDYELELRRRARPFPELCGAFSDNVSMFDRAWYGLHEVDQPALQRFQGNLERIRQC